jgi:hypothetical protein
MKAHRRFDVREEARVAQLAYGFLRGKSYRRIEFKCWTQPKWSRVATLISRYGCVPTQDAVTALKAWREAEDAIAKAA